jgi:predicted O-methyltransferase YrrM
MTDQVRPSWAREGITNSAVEDYLYGLLPERDPVLREMEEEARRRKIPIVGPAVGRFLYQLARLAGARTIFEMGSAIGYSTLWWARGAGQGGRVYYTDSDRRNADAARRYFERAGVADTIQLLTGDALELLSEQKAESFDIIFNDVDKEDYPRVFRLALPRLRRGGLLVSDNALWSGRVVDAARRNEASTKGILEFNRLLYSTPELFSTILPLRDGIGVAMKL